MHHLKDRLVTKGNDFSVGDRIIYFPDNMIAFNTADQRWGSLIECFRDASGLVTGMRLNVLSPYFGQPTGIQSVVISGASIIGKLKHG